MDLFKLSIFSKKSIFAQSIRDEEKFGSVEFFIEKRHLVYLNDLEHKMTK